MKEKESNFDLILDLPTHNLGEYERSNYTIDLEKESEDRKWVVVSTKYWVFKELLRTGFDNLDEHRIYEAIGLMDRILSSVIDSVDARKLKL